MAQKELEFCCCDPCAASLQPKELLSGSKKGILGEIAKRVRRDQGKHAAEFRLGPTRPSKPSENPHRVRRVTGAKQQAARRRFGYRCRNADYKWRLSLEGLNDMSDRFPIFDVALERRRRRWVWAVRTTKGMLVITGSRSSRSAARYEAHRARFLMLLSAPYRSRTSGREIQVSQAPARRSLRRGSLGGSQTGCS